MKLKFGILSPTLNYIFRLILSACDWTHDVSFTVLPSGIISAQNVRSHIVQNILNKYEMNDGILNFFSNVCKQFEMFVTFY